MRLFVSQTILSSISQGSISDPGPDTPQSGFTVNVDQKCDNKDRRNFYSDMTSSQDNIYGTGTSSNHQQEGYYTEGMEQFRIATRDSIVGYEQQANGGKDMYSDNEKKLS